MSAYTIANEPPRREGRSGLDIPLRVTFFKDHAAQTKQEAETTLRALVSRLRETSAPEKARLPWLKLATFGNTRTARGSLRSDHNMLEVYGVEADYDQETITVERARQIITGAGLAAVIYTSPSHRDGAPRWRVLCPLSQPAEPEARAGLLARLNGLFVGALAAESFTTSQAYYYGFVTGSTAHEVVTIEGRPLDQADELDAHAVGRPERPKQHNTAPAPRPASITTGDGTAYGLAALARECQAVRAAGKGHKWETINRAAYSVGGLVTAGELHEGPAFAALRDAVYALRAECEDFNHALETLRIGFEDGKAAPRTVPPPRLVRRVTEEFMPPEPPPRDEAPDWVYAEPEPMLDGPAPAQPAHDPLWVDAEAWQPEAIPPRPWLAPGYLLRGSVSMLSGAGAGGKSSLMVRWTIALATGQAVADFRPVRPMVVVNYNVEDDADEQQRRYTAALQLQRLTPADIAHRVIRCGPHNVGTLFERDPATGRVEPTHAMARLERLLIETRAECLVCDPLAELHNSEENDNTAMRAVVAAFRALAKRLNIAVLILHHDRKGQGAAGDIDRMRGAGAIAGAIRVGLTLTTMTQDEAEQFGIEPERRRAHFRVDGAKSNYAPAQDAQWWRLEGVEIANGEHVAACAPWSPPSTFASFSMADCVAILDDMHRGTPTGVPWAVRKEAAEEWAGRLLTRRGASEAQAKAMLAAWREAGTIIEADTARANSKHKRRGYVVNIEAVAEMRRQEREASR